METTDKKEEILEPVTVKKLLPPVYSRQLKLFGIVIWSDTRQLDEDEFYNRISDRINAEFAREILILRAGK